MSFFSKLKNTLNPKNVLNPVKAVSTAWDNTKSIVAQDSRNIRGMAGALGGTQDGNGLMSKLYREADKNVQTPTRAMVRAAITAAAIYTGGAAWAAYGGGAAGAGAGAAAGGAGATGAGLSGISGSIASALGPQAAAAWGGLSAVEQAAVLGALQGGAQGALGGGGWSGALKGAALGGFSGGVGAWAGPALSSATGMAPWASRAAVSAGLGGLGAGVTGGNVLNGALGAGLGSLAATGFGQTGMPSQLSSTLGGMAGRFASGALLGTGSGSAGGAGAPGGASGMAGGAPSGSGSTGTAMTGGLSGGWRFPTAGDTGQQQYMNSVAGTLQAEEQRKALATRLTNDPDFVAKLRENPDWATA